MKLTELEKSIIKEALANSIGLWDVGGKHWIHYNQGLFDVADLTNEEWDEAYEKLMDKLN